MKKGQKLWTRDELVLAINIYCKLPFGKLHKGNSEIIKLSKLLGRTPDAVAMKLVNFSRFDPSLQARGIKGMERGSKLDKIVWEEFYNNWDAAIIESEKLLAKYNKTNIEKEIEELNEPFSLKEGLDKEVIVKARLNQYVFRKIILATYNYTCCITGINQPNLLVASHIVPWSKDANNRLNPMNGLCLNALHDRAFDKGLITVDAENYFIRVSSKLKAHKGSSATKQYFLEIEGRAINLPRRFLPSKDFLKAHNDSFIP